MGKCKYDPKIHGDRSETASETQHTVPEQTQAQNACPIESKEDATEDYDSAPQERLEHLIRAARRNKAHLPGPLRPRVAKLLERLMLIFNRRFPGRRIHNYQSMPPPPKPRSS